MFKSITMALYCQKDEAIEHTFCHAPVDKKAPNGYVRGASHIKKALHTNVVKSSVVMVLFHATMLKVDILFPLLMFAEHCIMNKMLVLAWNRISRIGIGFATQHVLTAWSTCSWQTELGACIKHAQLRFCTTTVL